MLRKILLGLLVLVAVVLIVAAFQPADFAVSRSMSIQASPTMLFEQINDLHRWPAWSPYEKLDPAMKREFSGPSAGVGAAYAWAGNSKVGSGRMTVLESTPGQLVHLRLEFHEPMEGVADARFTLAREPGATRVTWQMTGRNNYVGKIFCLFMNMDKMVGGEFEEGLASLKRLAEKPSAPLSPAM